MADTLRDAGSTSHAKPAVESSAQRIARVTAPITALLAVVAVGLAIWALVSARSDDTPAPAGPGDRATVCDAFQLVSNAVQSQTHADLGPDPIAQKAVAGNARLALVGGGDYLLSKLGPDTPGDLADAVRSFAQNLQTIGMSALAEVPGNDPAQAARLTDGEASRTKIADLCK